MMNTSTTAGIVAIGVTVIFGVVICALLFRPVVIDPSVEKILFILSGALSAYEGTVVNFYLGSSSSSKTKDATISQIATTNAGTGNGTGASAP